MNGTKRRSVKKTVVKKKATKPLLKNIPDIYPELGRGVFTTPKKAKPEPHTKTFGTPGKTMTKSPTPKRKTPTPKRKTPTPKRKTPTPKRKTPTPKAVNYQKMTVAQLKEELRKQKKPVTGKKADLIARLTTDRKEERKGVDKIVGERGYQKMTVAQLKAELRKQKKPVSGKKADLVARLMENGEGGVKRKSPVQLKGKGEYQKMTVAQLKDELRKQKKPVSGKKADLIARLG